MVAWRLESSGAREWGRAANAGRRDRDLGKSACGVGVPNIRGVLGSKKNSWEFSQKGNFLEGFVVNFVNFGISLSPSLWSLHCNTFFI